jgi:AraC-like DNA-binding protein
VPISSVYIGHREIGRQGAAMLDELISDPSRPPEHRLVAAARVVERASTNAVAVGDPEVAAVLRAIRVRAGEPFTVADAIAAASLSRRAIEGRFRRVLGRSILDEIHRLRIARATAMLGDPQRSVQSVAADCGFATAAHFTIVFRRITGLPPTQWRKQHIAPSAPSTGPTANLANLGPKTTAWLAAVGVTTIQDLIAQDPVAIGLAVRAAGFPFSLNGCYAVAGAKLGVPWNRLPAQVRADLTTRWRSATLGYRRTR